MAVADWVCKNTVAAIATPSDTIAFGQFIMSNCSISGVAQSSRSPQTHSFNVNLSFPRRKLNSSIFYLAAGRSAEAGEQVIVQHVSVNEGGRAIVGSVAQDVPGSASQKSAACPLALTDSRQ